MVIPQQNAYTAVTAGVQLVNRKGALRLCALTAGSAAATCSLYDNTSATGNPILTLAAAIGQMAYPDVNGGEFNTGLYAVVAGTGAQLNVWYE